MKKSDQIIFEMNRNDSTKKHELMIKTNKYIIHTDIDFLSTDFDHDDISLSCDEFEKISHEFSKLDFDILFERTSFWKIEKIDESNKKFHLIKNKQRSFFNQEEDKK